MVKIVNDILKLYDMMSGDEKISKMKVRSKYEY